jgi:hypothetical protein
MIIVPGPDPVALVAFLIVANAVGIAVAVAFTYLLWRVLTSEPVGDNGVPTQNRSGYATPIPDVNGPFTPQERLFYVVLGPTVVFNLATLCMAMSLERRWIAAAAVIGNILIAIAPLARLSSARDQQGFHAFWYVWMPFMVTGIPMLIWIELGMC